MKRPFLTAVCTDSGTAACKSLAIARYTKLTRLHGQVHCYASGSLHVHIADVPFTEACEYLERPWSHAQVPDVHLALSIGCTVG
mmetsp:Transcript_14766/g.46177  ORF Transcript_14766/g.46177 Transcript_14766/m.46177 type:complete len:84 (-) Transcript_14766:88-339(-)